MIILRRVYEGDLNVDCIFTAKSAHRQRPGVGRGFMGPLTTPPGPLHRKLCLGKNVGLGISVKHTQTHGFCCFVATQQGHQLNTPRQLGSTNEEIPQTVLALRGSYGVAKAGAMVPLWSRACRGAELPVKMQSTLRSPS